MAKSASGPPPNMAQAFAEAVDLYRLGRLDEAEKIAARILKSPPQSPDALHLLGLIKLGRGRPAAALPLFDAALKLNPNAPDALSNRALALAALDRDPEALASVDQALAAAPDHPDALNNRGNVLLKLALPADALASFDRAVVLAPGHFGARISRGNALVSLGRFAEALAQYDALLAAQPASPELYFNRGNALAGLARPADAIAAYDRAIKLRPDHLKTHINRGIALRALNRHDEAIASFERALALDKTNADAAHNAALSRLTLGDYRRGFAQYESRWGRSGMPARRRRLGRPLWLGEYPLHRKTILLTAEQGLGDMIQFARYVPALAATGAKVMLEVPSELMAVLGRIAGVSGVVARGEALPDFDVHCPLGSLPLALGTEAAAIPAAIPYVTADEARIAKWRSRLPQGNAPRVALAWSGRAAHPNDRNRSIALASLAPLFGLKGIDFLSVQREVRREDAQMLAGLSGLTHLGEELDDFDDTAAVLALADLLISVDTSVAHLAGAMGRPTWILLPFCPDWRWMLQREDGPWYPTARLYRQTAAGDWESVVARLRDELARTLITERL
jgi:tetratricopeptide (TPR) repeat protein